MAHFSGKWPIRHVPYMGSHHSRPLVIRNCALTLLTSCTCISNMHFQNVHLDRAIKSRLDANLIKIHLLLISWLFIARFIFNSQIDSYVSQVVKPLWIKGYVKDIFWFQYHTVVKCVRVQLETFFSFSGTIITFCRKILVLRNRFCRSGIFIL